MSLIKCSECGHDVSNKAESCPNCGISISTPSEDGDIITVQHTTKKWKRVKIYSWIAVISGFLMFGAKESNELVFWIGVNVILLGIVGLITARLGAWWSTG
ncbi:zinc ribbon domain-containing protein [Candidatus Kaiserbacteria bacterium]|nr:zinc ribbon domain-containing protein [Candidatus Kaiserbacteria bacterium]